MKPTEFKQQTVVLGKYRPEYQDLPAFVTPDGEVITCWELTADELIELAATRKLWIRQFTFNKVFQPLLPQIDEPFEKDNHDRQRG